MNGSVEFTVSHADKNLRMPLYRNKLMSEEGKSTFGLLWSQRLMIHKPNWLGKPNRSKFIKYRVYWMPLTGLLRDKGETGIGIVIQTTEKLLSSNRI